MLYVKKTKKIMLLGAAVFLGVSSLVALTLNKVGSIENIFAAAMPAGFDDQNFYNCVLASFSSEYPNESVASSGLTNAQLAKIARVSCLGENVADSEKITSVAGLEKLTGLTFLDINNHKISSINLDENTNLATIRVNNNQLGSVSTNNNTLATEINIANNKLTSFSARNNAELTKLYADGNLLSEIDVTNNAKLATLRVYDNQLTSLDLRNNTELTDLWAYKNSLTSLDVKNNTKLTRLYVHENQLASLDVSKNTELTDLWAYKNSLTSLDVKNNTELTKLYVYENQLASLDVSKNTELTALLVYSNLLASLDVGNNTKLTKLYVRNNRLTSLDLKNNTELTSLSVRNNQLAELDLSHNTKLEELWAWDNKITELVVSNNSDLKDLYVDNILITAGIEDMDLTSGPAEFDLSNLKFISEAGNATINNTQNYIYNANTKLLSTSDFAKTKGFVAVSPIDVSQDNSAYKNYKLRIGKVDLEDNSVESEQNPKSSTADIDVSTPNTGNNTKENSNGITIAFCVLPLAIAAIAGALGIRHNSKSHRKFER